MSKNHTICAKVFHCPQDYVSPASFYGSHHLHFICFAGSGSFVCDDTEHKFGKNDLVIMQGDAGCKDITFSDDFSCIAFAVPRGSFNTVHNSHAWLASGFMQTKRHPVTHLEDGDLELILHDFAGIEKRMAPTSDYGRQSFYHTFQTLLYDMWNIFDQRVSLDGAAGSEDASFCFLKFQDMLRAHCYKERTVEWYADALNITPRKLSRICLAVSGSGACEWINHYTTLRIKELLENSGMPIEDICDSMHFSSRSYFTRYVTKSLGMTPTEFRKMIKKSPAIAMNTQLDTMSL